jgi:hypothetical protein
MIQSYETTPFLKMSENCKHRSEFPTSARHDPGLAGLPGRVDAEDGAGKGVFPRVVRVMSSYARPAFAKKNACFQFFV